MPELEPGQPARYFEAYLAEQGYAVERTLSFTGVSTIVLVRGPQPPAGDALRVVKGCFGYYTALEAAPPHLRPSMYGYHWYRALPPDRLAASRRQLCLEARLLRTLHAAPGWVRAARLQLDAPIPYFEMAYVPGGTLGDYLRQRAGPDGSVPVGEVVRLAIPLFEAVDALHGRGFVHRDLAPWNVLMDGDRPLLCDLGRAAPIGALEAALPDEESPPYWAPELDAPRHRVGVGVDLYALGCLLYRLLAGQRPRFGAPPLQQLKPAVGPRLAELVERCLAYDPAARPTSARVCADGLRSALA